ncbi:MAG: sigma-70 family RNA polymerase sigma factor [Ilumatobacteraceae bacterium]
MTSKEDRDDADLLRELGATYGRVVWSSVRRFERDPMEVEEIVADVFRLAYQHIDQLKVVSDSEARSWLLRTARFLTSNQTRRSMSRRRLYDRLAREPLPVAAAPDDELTAAENEEETTRQSERVCEVLSGLRSDYRQVLTMAALGEHGSAIGTALGVSANAARKRLMRARAAFREAYVASLGNDVSSSGGPDE